MKVRQLSWDGAGGWLAQSGADELPGAEMVLVFGARSCFDAGNDWFTALKGLFPKANVLSCTTAGEILGTKVSDNSIVATAVQFGASRIKTAEASLQNLDSKEAGKALGRELAEDGLRLVFVLCDGQIGNGSELAAGLAEVLPAGIAVTGGLAGDGDRFQETLIGLNTPPSKHHVVAIGFYGEDLVIGHGCQGGWDEFGPERTITESKGNVLYRLDSDYALSLYKRYLGEYSEGLPATGLLFPIALRLKNGTTVVRTLLAVDEENQSMTFAGDMPVGCTARLMRANLDRIVDAAESASLSSLNMLASAQPQLAILVSCVGRKFVLGPRVEEEVEAAKGIFGANVATTGFYSYGELSPLGLSGKCELHNQTMTITTIGER